MDTCEDTGGDGAGTAAADDATTGAGCNVSFFFLAGSGLDANSKVVLGLALYRGGGGIQDCC